MTRIVGIDIARGLAVLGMYGAHVGVTEPLVFTEPATWLDVVNGRSSILFALLAGVSIAIISGRTRPVDGTELRAARIRILVRAALIFAIGMLLIWLDTRIAVILPVYAVLFVAAIPVLRWRPRSLFVAAGILAIVSPILAAITTVLVPVADPVVDLLLTGHYPAVIWIVFVLVGLGVGRLDVTARVVQLRLLAVGAGLAVAGYGLGVAANRAVLESTAPVPVDIGMLATTEPHSGSPFEVVGSTGFALAVLALCLLVATRARIPLYPIAAVGSMALSAYTAHVVIVAIIGDGAFTQNDNGLYLAFIGGALVLCTGWALLFGRGPLERVLTWASNLAARTTRRART
ncbi:hypothetical protein GCM10027413_26690 [Conyzicola nivalis]|uniref:DUF418 domain-containing protein n=1 Tax=Conyzicola nivalis TaxID=1477021 RepID=A0A916STA9_9MICO|nr:heparan-alpha-glucosaminide N-acetyltransferase domain-containing protein [Conyzicola nivalis]GGB15647.1 hypothetical protein GCM10010979_32820 [Conyzicola nivalis]